MTTYEGQCLCGQVTWEVSIEADAAKHILCHCNTCKTLSGGAFTLNQIVPAEALKFTKGEDSLKKYAYKGDSGNDVNCYFCPTCSAHPYHQQTVMADKVIIRTILLKKGSEFDAAAEIYGKDRLAWEKEAAHTFPVLPPQ